MFKTRYVRDGCYLLDRMDMSVSGNHKIRIDSPKGDEKSACVCERGREKERKRKTGLKEDENENLSIGSKAKHQEKRMMLEVE